MSCESDELHERRIAAAMDAFRQSALRDERAQALQLWRVAVELIRARSPQQVERMERAQGLR